MPPPLPTLPPASRSVLVVPTLDELAGNTFRLHSQCISVSTASAHDRRPRYLPGSDKDGNRRFVPCHATQPVARRSFNRCFICGIHKEVFERAMISYEGQAEQGLFDDHVVNDHHQWNYLFFIVCSGLAC